MPMKNPVHPGSIVRHDCLEPLGLSISEAAKILGVTRQALNNIVSGKSGISPEMAIRLTKAFGSTEETWLRMQLAYDLAQARKGESKIKVSRQYVPQEVHIHRYKSYGTTTTLPNCSFPSSRSCAARISASG